MFFITTLLYSTKIILPITKYTSPKLKKIYQVTQIIKKNEIQENTKEEKSKWQIEIPKINLKAEIKDGIDEKTLNNYVAHFEESSYINGNVCLAAHNRGYKVNYFKNLKQLNQGDEIIYEFKNIKRTYIVAESKIIKDTDVEVIQNTKENIITLITCVENQPEKRRCIKGVIKDEN